MADDWDLYALVRSCTTADSSSSTISAAANLEEASPADSASMSFQDDDHNPFHFPTFLDNENNSFQGLEEIFKELYVNPHPILTTSQMTAAMSISFLAEPENQQQMEHQHPHMNSSRAASSLPVQTTTPQPNRSRRRKNQQAKIVHQMTQEELSTDSWAWRKYGQKPIKGSPYPRNYYRCSTLKGCVARKQVERSPTDPNMFVVSYTGEHSHPRPIHRSSLAGSTRNKSSGFKKPTSRDSTVVDTDIVMTKASCCSSSPASASSFSPKVESEEAAHEGTEKEEFDVEKDVKMVEEDEDDEDLLNPNKEAMSEEILENFNNLFELV